MGNLTDYARAELERAGLFREDSDYGGMLGTAVLKLVKVFAKEGHSGFSAAMATSLFSKVSRFEPLTPLTGEDDEWRESAGGNGLFQNKRCGRVFKGANGEAYDIDGKVFREPDGATFTSGDSRVPVTFPYTPTTEIIDVPEPA